MTKATQTVPCSRLWRLHIARCTGEISSSAGTNPPVARAGLAEPRPTSAAFQGLWPLLYAHARRLAPLVARGWRPAHTRLRLRRWRPRDTGRDAPLTRGATLSSACCKEVSNLRVQPRSQQTARAIPCGPRGLERKLSGSVPQVALQIHPGAVHEWGYLFRGEAQVGSVF